MSGLNLAFSIFVIRQILELFKVLKSLLNLKPKFKTVRQIFFTANFINLLKNFTSKFIKFTKKTVFSQTRLLSRAAFLLNFTRKTELFKFDTFESIALVCRLEYAKFDLKGHK
ncbi:hypothetical protein CSUNSWCD_2235 [Campylobacter showae CSUNSWCD]|uniref:Uncharacterized protein n=1 Tax=Campylobacter showae CSUNSWCD TaxID=1244083 RepID=M5IFD1_9BACT|nr:hypothetical protein CSUNSWCD_2235 [Campylobacter showae CSUNSWCD]